MLSGPGSPATAVFGVVGVEKRSIPGSCSAPRRLGLSNEILLRFASPRRAGILSSFAPPLHQPQLRRLLGTPARSGFRQAAQGTPESLNSGFLGTPLRRRLDASTSLLMDRMTPLNIDLTNFRDANGCNCRDGDFTTVNASQCERMFSSTTDFVATRQE